MYDSDCNISVCRFNLTGNNMMDIESSVHPGGLTIIRNTNMHNYDHIKVSDGSINNMMWHGQLYNINDYYTNECQLQGNTILYVSSEHIIINVYACIVTQ